MRRAAATIILLVLLSACGSAATLTATQVEPSAQPTEVLATEVPASPTASLPDTLPATPTLLPNPQQAQKAAMLPQFEADIRELEGAASYTIDLAVDFDGRSSRATMQGTARIVYQHQEAESIDSLPLMLWPNDEQYRGSMSVQAAMINGRLLGAVPELDGLAVRFPLDEPLEQGEALDITVPFQVVAEGPIGQGSPHRFGISEGVLFAPTFYPILPRRVDGDWEVKDAPPGGDTTNSVVAAYSVAIEAPADLALMASGTEVARQDLAGDRVRVEFVSGPMRDFAFALGNLQVETETVDGVEVHVWVLGSHQGDQRRVRQAASAQLALLSELVGPYPYEELDVVDVPGAYGGIEYPGLVTIGTLGTSWVIEPVVHEVAHQWFYGLLGDDQLEEPWLDEAFATYATSLYYENEVGSGRATGYLSDFRNIVRNHPDYGQPIGMGVGSYEGRDYSLFVYLKGALFYQELRQQLGDDTFFSFLQSLFQTNRYGVITSADFQAAAEDSCECQLDELFDLWVYEGGEQAIP